MRVVLDVVGVCLAAAVLLIIAFACRRRWVSRACGTFDCSLQLAEKDHGRGWALGLARYVGDDLQWFRVFSLAWWPKLVVNRRQLEGISTRRPMGNEPLVTYAGHVIVDVKLHDKTVHFAMTEEALTGVLAWMESAPPSSQTYH
jgi:hypothetical protein